MASSTFTQLLSCDLKKKKLRPQRRGCLLGAGGGGGERVKARPRTPTRKTEEAVDRHQNNQNVMVVSARHCVATSVLRNYCFNYCAEKSQGQCSQHCCCVTT